MGRPLSGIYNNHLNENQGEEFVNLRRACLLVLGISLAASSQTISLSGTVSTQSGKPVSGAIVKLVRQNLIDTTGTTGVYSFGGTTRLTAGPALSNIENIAMRNGVLSLKLTEPAPVRIEILDIRGHTLARLLNGHVRAGDYRFNILTKPLATQILVISVAIDCRVSTFRYLPVSGTMHQVVSSAASSHAGGGVLVSAAAGVDTLLVSKPGYAPKVTPITSYQGTVDIALDTIALPRFSFFVTSLKALQELSGSQNGFGGDFRFGKTGPGAGLRGADSICSCIAERSMPGSRVKQWRAFLSATADENGNKVNAIDRIGNGPWYDRIGRVLAPTKADLLNTRPANGDPAIANDLPNEDGIPNHKPDGITTVDNHHFVTGSSTTGTLYSATATCADWTSVLATSGKPRCGFSWPRSMGGGTSSSHWISGFEAGGCVAGIQITTANTGGNIIGSSGGYGGFYCFALTP
jgi:hypothetical protein